MLAARGAACFRNSQRALVSSALREHESRFEFSGCESETDPKGVNDSFVRARVHETEREYSTVCSTSHWNFRPARAHRALRSPPRHRIAPRTDTGSSPPSCTTDPDKEPFPPSFWSIPQGPFV